MSIDTEPGWRSEEDPSVIPEGVPVPMTVRNDGSVSMIQPGDRPEAISELDDDFTTFAATATITLNYDSRDGLVTTEDQARDDLMEHLMGRVGPDEFDITVRKI